MTMAYSLASKEVDKIKQNFRMLKNDMSPDDVLDYLYEHDIVSDNMYERIRAVNARDEKAELIVQMILRKDSNAYAVFVDALSFSDQNHLAAILATATTVASIVATGAPSDASPPKSDEADGEESAHSSEAESPSEALDWRRTDPVLNVVVRPCAPSATAKRSSHFVYQMTQPLRGRALVMCNSSFAEHTLLSKRLGADNDVVNVVTLFQKLSFRVEQKRDLTRQEMLAALENERQAPEHAQLGAFVLYLSSHGDSGAVFGTDGKQLLLSNVYDLFDGNGCPPLVSKPKLIIVEASRGRAFDRNLSRLPSSEDRSSAVALSPKWLDAESLEPLPATQGAVGRRDCPRVQQQSGERVASKADFVIALSTFDGYASLRSPAHGCWFSRALVEVFAKHACDEHIAELLKRVRRKMARVSTQLGYKQVSVTVDTLSRDMYLFPLQQAPNS